MKIFSKLFHSKKKGANDPPPTKLSLVRQSSVGEKLECCICLEKSPKGISCPGTEGCSGKSHFVCLSCFSPYVSSLCEESYKLLQSNGEIHCPVPDCRAEAWRSADVRKVLEGDVLEKYIDVLINTLQRVNQGGGLKQSELAGGGAAAASTAGGADSAKQRTANLVIEALTLKCPNCSVALDPNPDGCCAMRCGAPGCGVYFCWLCFSVQGTSPACHDHVRKCSENPQKGNLFVAKSSVEGVHKRRRIEAIRRVLSDVHGAGWRESNKARSREVLEVAKRVLADSKITPEEVLSSANLRPPVAVDIPGAAVGGERGGGGAAAGAAGRVRAPAAAGAIEWQGPMENIRILSRRLFQVFIGPNLAAMGARRIRHANNHRFFWVIRDFLATMLVGGAATAFHMLSAVPAIFSIIRAAVSVIFGRGYISALLSCLSTLMLLAPLCIMPPRLDHQPEVVLGVGFVLGFFGISNMLGLSSLAEYSGWKKCILAIAISFGYNFEMRKKVTRNHRPRSYGFDIVGSLLTAFQLVRILVQWKVSVWLFMSIFVHIVSTCLDYAVERVADAEELNTLYVYVLYAAGAMTRWCVWISQGR